MNISLVTDGIYPFVVGGMQKHSYYLAKYLSRDNIVDVYYCSEINKEKDPQTLFASYGGSCKFIRVNFPAPGRLPGHYIRRSKKYSSDIFQAFKANPLPDLIICKGFTAFEFIKRKKSGEKLPPVCINFHGYEMFQKMFSLKTKVRANMLKPSVKYLTENADYVFSYGGKITTLLREEFNLPEEKIIEIPSGVEEEFLSRNAGAPGAQTRFVFMGRYEDRKGLNELNEALRSILEYKDWTFDFIGDIPAEKYIKDARVTYHGVVSGSEKIKSLLTKCDVLVCPSWSEGMPNVILEAMAGGLAVLATDCGATRLLVNDNTGWLIDEPRPEILQKKLIEIMALEKAVIFRKKSAALQHIADEFTWEKLQKKLNTRLERIVYEHRS